MKEAGRLFVGVIAGVILVAAVDHMMGWITHLIFAWPRPTMAGVVSIFYPSIRPTLICGALIGATAAWALPAFKARHYQSAGKVCIIGSILAILVNLVFTLRFISTIFYFVDHPGGTAVISGNVWLWKLQFIGKNVVLNPSLELAGLLLITGLIIRLRPQRDE